MRLNRTCVHAGIITTASAMVTGLSLMYPPAWFLVMVGPAPFFFVLLSRTLTPSRTAAGITGVLFGFTFNGIINASGWSLYPLDWVGIPDPLTGLAIVATLWIVLSLGIGISAVLFALAVFEMRERGWRASVIAIGIALAWLAAEYGRMLAFSLLMLGPTSTVFAFLSTGSLGYAFGNAASEFWIALARWGGIAILSFVPVILSTLTAFGMLAYPDRKKMRLYAWLWGAVLAMFMIGSAVAAAAAERARGHASSWQSEDSILVVAAHTSFPAQLIPNKKDSERRSEVAYTVARALREQGLSPDLVVLPEAIGYTLDESGYAQISGEFPAGTLLVHHNYHHQSDGPTVIQTLAHTIGGDTAVTDKRLIIPYGEYAPYHFSFLLRFFPEHLREMIEDNRAYTGGVATSLGKAAGIPVGVRVCSEIFSDRLYAELANGHGAGILAHTSSLAMFHGSSYLAQHMTAAARVRAVENGLPIVQATNGWRGSAFDCRGRELSPLFETDTFRVYALPRSATCPGN